VNDAEVQIQLHLLQDIIAKKLQSPVQSLVHRFSLGALHLIPSNAEIFFIFIKVSSRTLWIANKLNKPCTGQREEVFECYNIYCNKCTVHLHYFVQRSTNAQISDNLSHSSYMFRHCCVILREFVVSTLPIYTSMSNAVFSNII